MVSPFVPTLPLVLTNSEGETTTASSPREYWQAIYEGFSVTGPVPPPPRSAVPAHLSDVDKALKWQPNTAYTAGAPAINPTGDLMVAKTSFTSGATYDATKWQLPPALSATYARLREHQRARLRSVPDALTVMTTPPTITKGAAGGAHTVGAGAVHVQSVDDPRIRIYGGSALTKAVRYAGPPIAYDNHQVTSTLDQLAPWVHSFMYYGTKFAFRLTETSPAGWYQLYVDGQPVTATPTAQGANTASSFSYTVDFTSAGGAKARHISLEVGYLGFAGLYIEPTAALWTPTTPRALRSVWLGDSYTVGSNSSAGTLFAPEAARLLGWNDCYVSGESGTGYLNPGSGGGRQKFRDRVAADVQPYNPDVIVVTGSTNDTGYSASAVGTEATALYAEIATRCPGVPVYVVGIQYPNNTGVQADATRDPIETAMQAAAAAAPNVKGYVSMKGWFSGSGTVSAPAGSGVNDVFMSADGLHPTSAGHQYMAKRVAQGIAGLLVA